MSGEEIRKTKGSVVYPSIERIFEKIGRDISLARRKRKISTDEFSSRAGISRATLYRLENGDPGVSLHTFAMALFVLGRINDFRDILDQSKDDIGMMMSALDAPKRIVREKYVESDENSEEDVPDSNGFVSW